MTENATEQPVQPQPAQPQQPQPAPVQPEQPQPAQPGWFDPQNPNAPQEAPQTGPATPEKLEVEKTGEPEHVVTAPELTATANESATSPGTLTPTDNAVPTATSNDTPAADQPRDAHPVLVHLEHVIQAVDLFVEEHPGLDRIFANGLKDALLAVEHAQL